jgi:hypothetical protein
MRRSHLVVGAFLLAGFGVCAAQQNMAQDSSDKSQSASEEYKITPAAAARGV